MTFSRENLIRNLRHYWLEAGLGLVIIAVTLFAIVTGSYTVGGTGLLYASAICYLLCFALTSFFLNRQGAKLLDRICLSILSMIAGIILFEIVYHYGFGIPNLPYFLHYELLFFGNQSANGYFSLDWYVLIFASLFIGHKYMSLKNKELCALIALGAVIMLVWIFSGYPQSFNPPWIANYQSIYSTFHIVYSSPEMILHYAEIFNSFAKIIAVIPALFFNKHPKISAQ